MNKIAESRKKIFTIEENISESRKKIRIEENFSELRKIFENQEKCFKIENCFVTRIEKKSLELNIFTYIEYFQN